MTIRSARPFVAMLLAAAFAACASSGGSGSADDDSRDVLTRQQLAAYEPQDAYTVIRRLRSSWLNARTTGSMLSPQSIGSETQIHVYVDGVRTARGVEELKSIDVSQIQQIRYLDGRQATLTYGTDHGAGAILVTTGAP
jgi:outer membrane cobalamin receptor